ncbi:multiple epidermal growth factor-like domains protein 6 [Saccostrea cucullata]|uniref:multiple epidermal growth factor-like domains protein 6 n=1 Tax=Saccostrea cuccullata TaxID=36930 RepID=UPI002ED3E9D6
MDCVQCVVLVTFGIILCFPVSEGFSIKDRSGNFIHATCLYCEPKTCDNTTGVCERCLTGFYGEKCENTCPNTCSTCEKSNGRCLTCIDGWFGENCNFECIHCFSCHKDSGACTSCQPNYWGPQCQNECEYNCHVCSIENGQCIHCAQGYFGDGCTSQCGHCRRGLCDRATGTCQFGCNDGFYGDSCEKQCSQNCMVCNQTDGECLMCQPNLWGSQCDYTCPTNCDFCHVSTGECLECVEGYHGDKCQERCGNCIGLTCEKDTGYCEYGCQDGWFGGKCDQKCIQNCSKCTSKDECMVCIPGLAGSRCDIKCPEICSSCSQDMISNEIVCSECAAGYSQPQKNCSCTMSKCTKPMLTWAGSYCDECEANSGWYLSQGACCPCKHCAGGNQFCSRDGTCINGCEPNYYPKDQGCDTFCDLEHCTWCEPFFGYGKVCVGCDSGYFLEKDGYCYPCSENCKGGKEKCHTTTGSCTDGCEEGWFGDRCDSTCHAEHCAECDNTANTCQSCKYGYYGKSCSQTCATNCTKCSRDTGSCLECVTGRFSEDCSKTCDNCIKNECEVSGKCLHGCEEGWFGTKCNEMCMEGCSKCSSFEICEECYNQAALLNGKCYSSCSRCVHSRCSEKGECELGCVDGWYGKKCDHPCPIECSKCNSKDSCVSCLRGFKWEGKRCISTCENCKDQLCSSDGVCDHGCNEGWYGKKCIEECVKGCISCADGQKCDKCRSGYQLSGNKCIAGCDFCLEEDCDIQRNCHLGCKDGHFGPQCTGSCMKGCQVCDSAEKCTKCSPGFQLVNNYCKASCANCADRSCDADEVCLSGCVDGWFGKRCNQKCAKNCAFCNSDACLKCDTGYDLINAGCDRSCGENCISCEPVSNPSEPLCTKCKDGYYTRYGLCQKCSSTCKNGACEGTTAQCLEGCVEGWTGLLCNTPMDGTKIPTTDCLGSCLTCNQATKQCSSCIAGMWGKNCKQRCPAKCDTCDQQTGQCMVVCSKYCNRNVNSISCNNVTGACLQGCEDGWYGDQCQKRCPPNCIDGTCERTQGHCVTGCVPGWKGITCSESSKSTAIPSMGMIAGAVIAAIVGVAIIVIITYFFCCRKKKRVEKDDDTYTNISYPPYTNNGFMLDSGM